MLILFDHGLFDHGAPRDVARVLRGHTVITAKVKGWDRLTNGDLLTVAEEAAVDLLFTTDRRIRYQQNLTSRRLALLVLTGTAKWSRVRLRLERIAACTTTVVAHRAAQVLQPMGTAAAYPLTDGSPTAKES